MRRRFIKQIQDIDESTSRIDSKRGKTYFVDGWYGHDDRSGSNWDNAFLTMEKAFTVIASDDTIYLSGKITEQITAPLGVYDVTIIGACNKPRQSTNNGAMAGYSAYWMYEADNKVALLTLREQGWTIDNVCFQAPASTATTAAAILAVRAETATYPDPSHLTIKNCYFAGGGNGIIDSGGVGFVTLENNTFYAQTGFSVQNIAGAGIAAPLMWQIKGNRFLGMANGIYSAFSHGVIKDNIFTDGGTPNTTVVLDTAALGGGGNNFIINNFFQTTTANFNTPDVVGNATDVWFNNSIDGQTSMIGHELGQPA